jgi:molybdopterin converting factor subunit 1
MTITVRLFAILREKAGVSEIALELSDGATADSAIAEIGRRYPELKLASAAVAVNQEYAARQTALRDGDELALIPPVSGG